MAAQKQTRKKDTSPPDSGFIVSRPLTPGADYGITQSEKGLLPWQHVADRMAAAKCYWISTVDPANRPHATPVDGVWLDNQLYFGGSLTTRRNRNLLANSATCVHLESGTDVIILHGDAQPLQAVDRSLAVRLSEASTKKYGYGPQPEDYVENPGSTFAFRPRVAFAWKDFPQDVTRWLLP